jgi:hypothetical protein
LRTAYPRIREIKKDCRTIYSMDANQITPEFIEAMTDKIILRLTDKLEQLDISLDYIAGALLDADALGVAATQATRGRAGSVSTAKISTDIK